MMSDTARFETYKLSCLGTLKAKKLLFLLPGDAIGDNVGYFLFIQAVIEQLAPRRIAVFNAGAASDIYHLDPRIEVFPLWISKQQINAFDRVIDLLDVPELRTLAEKPCDPEVALTTFTGLPPTDLFSTTPKISGIPSRFALFPLASSPMRSLPIELCKYLIRQAAATGVETTIHLNSKQRQSAIYAKALTPLAGERVKFDSGCSSLGELLSVIGSIDYGIFCDSGPAHLSKLFATRGMAIHTSADATPLRGRFANLQTWQSGYIGKYCAAPCGLAGPRVDRKRRIGCMGSLNVPRDELEERAVLIDDATNAAMIANPIPCVAHLNTSKEQIWQAIRSSWTQREPQTGDSRATAGSQPGSCRRRSAR